MFIKQMSFFTLFKIVLSAVLHDPVSANLPLTEHRLDVFASEVIPDLRQMSKNILSCAQFAIIHFCLGLSKEPKVTWAQIRRITGMKTAYEAFPIEFFLDCATIMTF
jgi:hypothetical protein